MTSVQCKTLIFSAGTAEVIANIPIVNDNILENVESLSLRVTVPDDLAGLVLLGRDFAILSITDDDCKTMP